MTESVRVREVACAGSGESGSVLSRRSAGDDEVQEQGRIQRAPEIPPAGQHVPLRTSAQVSTALRPVRRGQHARSPCGRRCAPSEGCAIWLSEQGVFAAAPAMRKQMPHEAVLSELADTGMLAQLSIVRGVPDSRVGGAGCTGRYDAGADGAVAEQGLDWRRERQMGGAEAVDKREARLRRSSR